MIYSATSFFNENSLFEIRRHIMEPLHCIHLVSESIYTHSGDEKPLLFEGWRHPDVISGIYSGLPTGDPWDAEKAQRDHALHMFDTSVLHDDDIFIITDLDEIPDPEAVRKFDPGLSLASLTLDHYSYYLNVLQGRQTWSVPKICTWKYLKDKTLSKVRNGGAYHSIDNAGHHFAWLGGCEKIIEKFWAYAHTESLNKYTTDPENIKRKLEQNQSLWTERPDDLWTVVPIDDKFPQYIRDHEKQLTDSGLIKPYK